MRTGLVLFEVDPSIVRPGLTPLLITALLGVALVFLFFSLRKQLRKIRTPDDIEAERAEAERRENAAASPPQEAESDETRNTDAGRPDAH